MSLKSNALSFLAGGAAVLLLGGGAANASTVHYVEIGASVHKNDGEPVVVITDGEKVYCIDNKMNGAYPISGPKGEFGSTMLEGKKRASSFELLQIGDTIKDNVARYDNTLGWNQDQYVQTCKYSF